MTIARVTTLIIIDINPPMSVFIWFFPLYVRVTCVGYKSVSTVNIEFYYNIITNSKLIYFIKHINNRDPKQ